MKIVTIIGSHNVPLGQLRNTKQRKVILEELAKLESHPTASELYEIVRKRLPRISLGTVYRNLEILSQFRKINTLHPAGFEKRFDGRTDLHYHVRCVRCGRLDDVPLEPFDTIDEAARNVTEYEILSHSIEFVGVCARCRSHKEKEP